MCVSAELPAGQSPTLTEVACLAVYGAPLKPGTGAGTLREQLTPLQIEGRALWCCANGPGWLRPHLELIAAGRSWLIAPDAASASERITLEAFAATARWLSHGRKLPASEGTPAEVVARKARLAEMSDAEAIDYARAEAERIERAERVVNARVARFYEQLSEAIIAGTVELNAIPVNPTDGSWQMIRPGRPPHVVVAPAYFNLPHTHNLYDNQLDVHRHGSEQEAIDSIFNRIERAKEGKLVSWSDVRMSPQHAAWLLSNYAARHGRASSTTDHGHADLRNDLFERVRRGELTPDQAEAEAARFGLGLLNPRPNPAELDPMKEVRWTFAMALAWIVWRDPDKVRKYWPRWRSELQEWRVLKLPRRSPDGATRAVEEVHLVPVQDQHGTSESVDLDALIHHALGRQPCVPPDEARAELWRALQEGKLEPDGIDAATGRRVPIPAREFLDLTVHRSPKGQDCLDAGARGYKYGRPTVSRASTVSEWPEGRPVTGRQAAGTPTAEANSTSARSSRPGRKKGQGSFEALDEPLVLKMRDLLMSSPPEASSAEAAAAMFAPQAHGAGTLDSKATRLARRYREKYPPNSAPKKSD